MKPTLRPYGGAFPQTGRPRDGRRKMGNHGNLEAWLAWTSLVERPAPPEARLDLVESGDGRREEVAERLPEQRSVGGSIGDPARPGKSPSSIGSNFFDDVHGSIQLSRVERDLVDTPEFQRLFRLGQLGFVVGFSDRKSHSGSALHWRIPCCQVLGRSLERQQPRVERQQPRRGSSNRFAVRARVDLNRRVAARFAARTLFARHREKETSYRVGDESLNPAPARQWPPL